MHDFLAQMVAELRARGLRCLIYGPEAWLGLTICCFITAISNVIVILVMLRGCKMINIIHLVWVIPACVIVGMILAALLTANWR